MGRSTTDSKSKKHHRKKETLAESSSDDSSPQRDRKSKKRRDVSPVPSKHKKKAKKTRRRDSSSSNDTDSGASPPKRNKNDREEKNDRRQRDDSDPRRRRDSRERRRDAKPGRERSPRLKIKREEDFDKRQEEIRKRRRRDIEHRPHGDIRIKQERRSDDEGGTNRDDQRDNRSRRERVRRENDARRAEAWQKREQQGRRNAEVLLEDTEEPKEKEKPNLGLSGALTEDTNTFRGVVIKYSEPPEARVPTKKWRLYPFKGDEALKVNHTSFDMAVMIYTQVLHLHRQSAYLMGKLRRIADIPIDHPSCSKQHAVFQFRMVEVEKADGRKKRVIKPYIIDLDSANGTFVNNQKIQPRRYVELKEKDVVKFAYSSREYVLIHDKSDTTEVAESEEDSDED